MQTSDRGLLSPFGSSRSSLIALSTLIAAIGFTPWMWGTWAPWGQFAFRTLGLTALFAVSFALSKSSFARSVWEARVTRAMLAFVMVSALSAALSIHRGKSLEAMLNLLAVTGLFLTTSTLVRGAGLLRGVALFEVFAALPVAALGLIQHFRPELLPAGNSYPGRALGPFGQPNRMGGYLIAAIPVALALAIAAQDRVLKVGIMVAAFGLMFSLVATYSRGAWLGLAAGLLVLAAALVRWPELLPRPAVLAASVACVSLPVLFLLPSVISRIEARPSATPAWNLPIDPEREGSGAMRRAIWAGALRATAQRPVLGSGIGAFREAFDRSKGTTMKQLEAVGGRTADQAHNHYLGLLAERGVLGLAAFAILTALSLGAAAAALASGTPTMGRVLVAGLAGSVVALLAHGLADDNLSLVPHGTVLFANLGLLAAAPASAKREARGTMWMGRAGMLAAFLAMSLSIVSFVAAGRALAAAARAEAGRADLAAADFRAASNLAPWRDDFAVGHAEQAEAWARQGAGSLKLMEAEAAYRRAIEVNGSDPVTRQELARLYLAHPDLWGDGVNRALKELRAAVAQNPFYAEIQNDLGVALLRAGDRGAAREAFGRAALGKREFVDPLLNLAALALQSGDRVEARAWLNRALDRDPRSPRARALLAELGN
ncbi:MAG: tetratricopeptide repeat protein [Candidatus Eisenbacteria bacterium]|uniref:Tetratricopeptide repeat protein n=1 Tax=Eiseniibacteriota bacterium TaxID=2212470 RepID=A0A538T8M6_UNCEI|nr:MAG: tetratricopeptide repeat protein [Candidatus Eisenbacteria bacterium]